ncbi:MAG: hypothetical protein D6722_26445 [Bacteroidetes bacterium]|nr:MAG: hypothetical protein D6722_26445 [Bacteroidota bacterium]
MPTAQDIPFLLKLLDDESPLVRREVEEALRSFGDGLETVLFPHLQALSPEKEAFVTALVRELRMDSFEAHWLDWLDIADEHRALESAFRWLSYRDAMIGAPGLGELLDELASRFHGLGHTPETDALMGFLFRQEGFGPPRRDYYHPRNSNLIYVLHRKEGLQISLTVIAVLLGRRLGLELYGFNLPGHFMIMAGDPAAPELFDPFNKGKRLPQRSMGYLEQSLAKRQTTLAELRAQTHEIVLRAFRNLINAAQQRPLPADAAFYQEHLTTLIAALRERRRI